MSRQAILDRFRTSIDRGEPLIGCGAGIGLSAASAETAGADLIIIYNSGRYQMAGRGSMAGLMPYGDANAIVVQMACSGRRLRHGSVPPDAGAARGNQGTGFCVCRTIPLWASSMAP